MLQRMRDQIGTAGLMVAIVALVVALGGGAYAASGGLNGKQKRQVANIAKTEAKKFAKRGKNGQNGLNGANGAPGTPGAKGATGATGAQGSAGSSGSNGAAGQSVNIAPYEGEECASEEGTEFSDSTGTSYACNGENGQSGFTETLPSGETEHGTWSVGPYPAEELRTFAPFSFNIPLAELVPVHYMAEEAAPTTECPGTAAEPKALAGNMCVYVSFEEETTFVRPENAESGTGPRESAGPSGTSILFELKSEEAKARGVWVVTAP